MPFSHLPKNFTAPANSEGFCYSNQLPGILDIRRLIAGEPAFGQSCVIDGDLRPKTLVLADHLLRHYSPNDLNEVLKVLVDLADLGFQFYSIRVNDAVAFKPDLEMSCAHPAIHDITPTTPAEIYAKMAALGHSGSDVTILDSLSLHNAPFKPNYELLNHLKFNPQLLTQSINYLNNQHLVCISEQIER